MQRTIEKLSGDRRAAEENLHKMLADVRHLAESLDRVSTRLSAPPSIPRKRFFRKPPSNDFVEIRAALAETASAAKTLTEAVAHLAEIQDSLSDTRDKLWDVEGNNHVGMIFKSMEWRVDRLSTAYEDASVLMRTFSHLKDQMGRLLTEIEDKKLPTPAQVGAILEPLEDWRYLRFENRFRGTESEIQKQQNNFLGDFPSGGHILDLGCGRGEFLDLLVRNGFQAEGIDLNAEMVGLCRDKGLSVERGDLIECLSSRPDAALDGIFSSQVIEHLIPAALRRLIELAYAKLKPGGLLLLETVNPTSVFALVQIYFLDFTHRTPVHPQALQFLMEAAGFTSVITRFGAEMNAEKLQNSPLSDEATVIANQNWDRLNALLYAPANYSVLGRKP